MSQYTIEASTGQDIGDREEQQDRVALLVAPRAPGYLLAIIADGMGGRSGGAMAAEQVIRTARQQFETFSPAREDIEQLLQNIVMEAHTVIRLNGMSSEKEPHSTVVLLAVTPDRGALWAHVGDSRLYRFDGPNLIDHTVDHSFVQKLVSEGKLSQAEARQHRLSNVLINVLGSTKNEPFVTTGRCDTLGAGLAFVLCTDGVWQHLADAEMGAAVAVNRPKDAAEMLIRKARERVSDRRGDNCSLAIVKLAALAGPTKK